MPAEPAREEAILSDLINQCGKMRMLSHRAVMIALFEMSGNTGLREQNADFSGAIREFVQIANRISIQSGKSDLPSEIIRILSEAEAISPLQESHLAHFIENAKMIEPALSNDAIAHPAIPIAELAKFVATTLLDSLNAIVMGVSKALKQLLKEQSEREQKNAKIILESIGGSIGSIEQISRTVRMISYNASIEATRAGEKGMGFSEIAKEIRNLSDMTADSVLNLRQQLDRI